MPGADHAPVVEAAPGSAAVQRARGPAQVRHEALEGARGGHQVVGGDAGLAGVGELAPHDAAGGDGEVRALVHEHRGLPAQLEHGGRQVLGGGAGHDPAHGAVAGVEDQVEALLEQDRGLLDTALDHSHPFVVQVGAQQVGECRGGRGCHLAGLHDRGVAAGDRRDQGREGEVHRVVPRRDDQRGAQRLSAQLPGGGREHRPEGQGRGLQPGLQVLRGVRDLLGDHADLGHRALGAGLAQVLRERAGQARLLAAQAAAQRLELGQARLEAAGGAGVEGAAQRGDLRVDAGAQGGIGLLGRGLVLDGRHGVRVGPAPARTSRQRQWAVEGVCA